MTSVSIQRKSKKMRLSSIDIGSNAIRQVIVEVKPDKNWVVLKKHRETIRLGTDVFSKKIITGPTQIRLIAAFKRMSKLNKKYKVDHCLAFATSAFRDAKNRKLILSAIYKQSRIKIQVISGQKEAELIRRAVQKSIRLNNENCLLIDIGGGSVELTHLFKNKIYYSKSFKWGMVRTLSESQKSGKTPQEILKLKLNKQRTSLPKSNFNLAIGTGGNMDALARLKLSILKNGPNTFVTRSELKRMYTVFLKTPHIQRVHKFNLRPDRIDVIEPAMFLTISLMNKYNIEKLKIPSTGLKEGAILSLL